MNVIKVNKCNKGNIVTSNILRNVTLMIESNITQYSVKFSSNEDGVHRNGVLLRVQNTFVVFQTSSRFKVKYIGV